MTAAFALSRPLDDSGMYRSSLSMFVSLLVFCCLFTTPWCFNCFSEYEVSWWGARGEEFNYTFSASHFQLKAINFYETGKRPPLKEAYVLARSPRDFVMRMIDECPSTMVIAYGLLAESRLSIDPEDAAGLRWLAVFQAVYEGIPEPRRDSMLSGWPLYRAVANLNGILQSDPMTAEAVYVGCMPVETLLNGTRITTYDTCAGPWHGWSYCEAYADFLRSGKPDAGFVLFLNGNFSVEYVELVIRSIQAGTFHARFAYLGEGRQLKTAEADVCGLPTGERLAGYDGGLFVTRRDALQSVVSSGMPSCDCDSLDRVWHVLFGQPEEYSRISESLEIPMGLRLKYLDTHTRESWLNAELGPVVPSRPMPMPWEEDSDMDWGGGRIMDPL